MTTQKISKKELLGIFEKLATRVDMLPVQQRTFVRLFQSTQKYRPIAKTAGVNEANIARRLKKIAERISSNNFIAALSQNGSLPPRNNGNTQRLLRRRPANDKNSKEQKCILL